MSDARAFYDAAASFYDAMTGTGDRIPREQKLFEPIIRDNGIHNALDVGTGTGANALSLAKLGVSVTGIDVSPAMIARLNQNALAMGLSVCGMVLSMLELPRSFDESFDALFCLGNTFPHLATDGDRRGAAEGFLRVLRPGGLLMLQMLNFDRLGSMAALPRIIKQSQDTTWERRYERTAGGVRLSIETRDDVKGVDQSISLDLHPVSSLTIRGLLSSAGFSSIALFGDLSHGKWDPDDSKDLVVVASKPHNESQ